MQWQQQSLCSRQWQRRQQRQQRQQRWRRWQTWARSKTFWGSSSPKINFFFHSRKRQNLKIIIFNWIKFPSHLYSNSLSLLHPQPHTHTHTPKYSLTHSLTHKPLSCKYHPARVCVWFFLLRCKFPLISFFLLHFSFLFLLSLLLLLLLWVLSYEWKMSFSCIFVAAIFQ